jgi:ADP-heptose:LPS heptosyltransferase
MNTTFILDGGAGRLVTAIPALERYAIENPEDDFRVLTAAWESLYWSHPILQNKTYNINQKGVFELHMKNRRVIHPEPYSTYEYYNQKKHLIECFDQLINHTENHTELDKPNLYITKQEDDAAKKLIMSAVQKTGKSKVIVFQPYGSGMKIAPDRPYDESHRSLDVDFALKLIYNMSKEHTVIFFGDSQLRHPGDSYSISYDEGSDLRMYMSLISNCDHFVGIDSVGQHIARSFNKPATIILCSTFAENVSYPDKFNIYRNKHLPVYVPIRISQIDCDFANNLNYKTTLLDETDIHNIIELINES